MPEAEIDIDDVYAPLHLEDTSNAILIPETSQSSNDMMYHSDREINSSCYLEVDVKKLSPLVHQKLIHAAMSAISRFSRLYIRFRRYLRSEYLLQTLKHRE